MSEITPEEKQRIIDKWKHILDFDDSIPRPLSATKCILIESQERWYTKEDVEAATPTKKLC